MNFFFFAKIFNLSNTLTVPKFQNSGRIINNKELFQADIIDGRWTISMPKIINTHELFWSVSMNDCNRNSIYFIATDKGVSEILRKQQLLNVDDFTETVPDFRANLMIENENNGFSSYQSEYPFAMTTKLGTLYADCGVLTSEFCKRVGVVVRNIHHKPITEARELILYNNKSNKILKTYPIYLNESTFIDLTEFKTELINCLIFARNFLGIPIFFVEYIDGSLSFEHTHPPHESIAGSDRYELVNKVKNEAYQKIYK